jgi:hydrogenase maturation protein HypF
MNFEHIEVRILNSHNAGMQRCGITVRGIVQGVGFRPFVHHLASRLNLRGFVSNQMGSVRIEVEGEPEAVERFVRELVEQPPRLARIDALSSEALVYRGEREFRIESSTAAGASEVFVSPDVATCDECLAELFSPHNRRFRYPFINCVNCGPRLTITTGAPFDRPNTTMAPFSLCHECRAEFETPGDRRFHAQAIACPNCGPRLGLRDAWGRLTAKIEPLAGATEVLRSGGIIALKGLGGFHLVCDATNEAAVKELRRRKHRDEKPFAIMVRDVAGGEELCAVNAAERELLRSVRRPIVLLHRKLRGASAEAVAEAVAPRNPFLGVMLPYTPLHHLLLHAWGAGSLVMTSGNRSDEPIASADDDAVERLAGIADLFLTHDRLISIRCDDSLTRIVAGSELQLRRSRGDAPRPLKLPHACPRPILAVGGQFKGTFALGRERQAFLSHHLGDLDHYAAYQAFERDILLYQQLFGIQADLIVHDLHPEYASTRYAHNCIRQRSGGGDAPQLFGVQHHHAHVASCMAENGLSEPVIGVAFDGTGYGTDGAIWGGEFLVGDYLGFRRAAHLRYVGLPGGDRAIHEPWRMAASHLLDAGCSLRDIESRVPIRELRTIRTMLDRQVNTPQTSSMGRLFDAVAAIAGDRDRVAYEGQAAMQLEWLATDVADAGAYPFEFQNCRVPGSRDSGVSDGATAGEPLVIDTRPLIRAVAEDAARAVDPSLIARRFHTTVVEIISAVCRRLRGSTGLNAVTFSGGVFMNALLTRDAGERLGDDGFRVYRHGLVPPNDGGLSLGQLAIAAIASVDST